MRLKPKLATTVTSIRSSRGGRVNPIVEARAYLELSRSLPNGSQRAVAQFVGVSQARISQRLALLDMPGEIIDLMLAPDSRISERHARSLRRLPDRSAGAAR